MRVHSVSTRITRLFKCQYPIVLPGMSWISTPELVAAVSNAGGVGILATGPLTSDQTRHAIHRIRELTNLPFGIGATLLMPGASDNAKVALEEHVPIINVSLGKTDWIANAVHAYGGILMSTVTNAKHAGAALDAGADALLVTGHEAAAHGGDVTSLVLVNCLSERFPDIPLVAAGGFANGKSLAAAFNLGADAVAMGSRLAVSIESPLAESIKTAIVAASESDTIYGSNFDGIPARVLKTPTSQSLMNSRPFILTILYRAFKAASNMNIPLWKVIPGMIAQYDKMFMIAQFGAATQALMKATIDGKLDEGGVQFIGQSAGIIHSIETVDAIVQDILMEAQATSLRTSSLFPSASTATLTNVDHLLSS